MAVTRISGSAGKVLIPAGAGGQQNSSVFSGLCDRWSGTLTRGTVDGTTYDDITNFTRSITTRVILAGSLSCVIDGDGIPVLTHFATVNAQATAGFKLLYGVEAPITTTNARGFSFSGMFTTMGFSMTRIGDARLDLAFVSSGAVTTSISSVS